jgi:hypothetical protein
VRPWDGTLIQKLQDDTLRAAGLYAFTLALQRRDGARDPFQWKLYQNYPNPFN